MLFMFPFFDNSSNQAINFYLKSIWWKAAKLVLLPAMLLPSLETEVRRGKFGGFMDVFLMHVFLLKKLLMQDM